MVPCSVKELMRECDQAVVAETMLLREAAATLVVNNFSVLVAVNADGSMAGLIPEAAIIRQLMGTPNRLETVGAVVSRHVESVRPETEISAVLHLFRSSCHAVLPVVTANNHIAGLLHRADIVRLLLEETAGTDGPSQRSGKRGPHFADRDERKSPKRADAGDEASGSQPA